MNNMDQWLNGGWYGDLMRDNLFMNDGDEDNLLFLNVADVIDNEFIDPHNVFDEFMLQDNDIATQLENTQVDYTQVDEYPHFDHTQVGVRNNNPNRILDFEGWFNQNRDSITTHNLLPDEMFSEIHAPPDNMGPIQFQSYVSDHNPPAYNFEYPIYYKYYMVAHIYVLLNVFNAQWLSIHNVETRNTYEDIYSNGVRAKLSVLFHVQGGNVESGIYGGFFVLTAGMAHQNTLSGPPNNLFYEKWITYINSAYLRDFGINRNSGEPLWDVNRTIFDIQLNVYLRRNRNVIVRGPRQRNPRQQNLAMRGRAWDNRRNVRQRFVGGKIFFHPIDPEFNLSIGYFNKGALGEVPMTIEKCCLPMSILQCQIRSQIYNENTSVWEWMESESKNTQLQLQMEDNRYIRIPHPDVDQPATFICDGHIIIGNTYDIHKARYPLWIKTALQFHQLVSNFVGEENLSYNDLIGTTQHYSDYLQVVFHIFNPIKKGRWQVIYPQNQTFWNAKTFRHIYLLVNNNHVYPIINIRHFLHSKQHKQIDLFQLCDFCQRITSSDRPICHRHITSCMTNKNFVSEHVQLFIHANDLNRTFNRFYTNFHLYFKSNSPNYQLMNCNTCSNLYKKNELDSIHHCRLTYEKEKSDLLPNNKLYVLDIESMQYKKNVGDLKLVHECVLLCMSGLYNGITKEFLSISDFVDYLVSPINDMGESVFIAHNGGGYDFQFFLSEWEKRNLTYEKVPRPSSQHKYLQLNLYLPSGYDNILRKRKYVEGQTIRFMDFMMLIPGSLKSIAQSFKLPVQKGDFPHRFLTPETKNYVGPLPPLQSEEDFFSYLNRKSMEEQEELTVWYTTELQSIYCSCPYRSQCTCNKPPWDCFLFLTQYCWLDVIVLRDAVTTYREFILTLDSDFISSTGWSMVNQSVDPLLCMTQSQIAMKIFCLGWKNAPIQQHMYVPKQVERKRSWKSFKWLHSFNNRFIEHLGNTGEEPYLEKLNMFIDGKCSITGDYYIYLLINQKDPSDAIKQLYGPQTVIHVEYEEQDIIDCDDTDDYKYLPYTDREIFYGGKTEVFSAYASSEALGASIHYHDVCSLYPYICSFKRLPIGVPTYYYLDAIDFNRIEKDHPDRYFGFIKCKVVCNKQDYIGLLPSRDSNGRLVFNLLDKVGFWHTEELFLAMEHGYEITEMYQVIHFPPEETSTTFMRGYMEFFLLIKLESEGWIKLGSLTETPTEEEKDLLCDLIYRENGNIARPRKDRVAKNPVRRMIAKLFLNCVWGKLCQAKREESYTDIQNYHDYETLMFDSNLDKEKMVFRQYEHGLKVQFSKSESSIQPNKKYNIFIAASVTAHGRCILHRKMFEVGPRNCIYCDTDSLVFMKFPHQTFPMVIGTGLGNWTDEYAGKKIERFYAIAPKFYTIFTSDTQTIKSKGIWLTVSNKLKLAEDTFKLLLFNVTSDIYEPIYVDNMTIFPNTTDSTFGYGTMFTRYNKKKIQAMFTKRVLIINTIPDTSIDYFERVKRIDLLPIGYVPSSV
jgi:hypothetical protein